MNGERRIVQEIFGPGRKDPYPDEMQDAITDWLDGAAVIYLQAKRGTEALVPLVPQLALLLDRILLSRLRDLRAAVEDVREDPPYFTADRWPHAYLVAVEKVMRWAFGGEV